MGSGDYEEVDEATALHRARLTLRDAASSLTPGGARRPMTQVNTNHAGYAKTGQVLCNFCGFQGHNCKASNTAKCRDAIFSTARWWDEVFRNVYLLKEQSDEVARQKFRATLRNNTVTADLAFDKNYKPLTGDMDTVSISLLSQNWLKFSRLYADLGLKANVIFNEDDKSYINDTSEVLDKCLLDGRSYFKLRSAQVDATQ